MHDGAVEAAVNRSVAIYSRAARLDRTDEKIRKPITISILNAIKPMPA